MKGPGKWLTWAGTAGSLFLFGLLIWDGQWMGAIGWAFVAFDNLLYLAKLYTEEAAKP